jgi:hypothetical protein
MRDDPFFSPTHKPPAPEPLKPGELLFEFLVGHDRFLCELRDHGPYGVEAQFYQNEEFLISHRFDRRLDPTRPPRELAVQWAEEMRKDIEKGGA